MIASWKASPIRFQLYPLVYHPIALLATAGRALFSLRSDETVLELAAPAIQDAIGQGDELSPVIRSRACLPKQEKEVAGGGDKDNETRQHNRRFPEVAPFRAVVSQQVEIVSKLAKNPDQHNHRNEDQGRADHQYRGEPPKAGLVDPFRGILQREHRHALHLVRHDSATVVSAPL
jgi:hypothetical protein